MTVAFIYKLRRSLKCLAYFIDMLFPGVCLSTGSGIKCLYCIIDRSLCIYTSSYIIQMDGISSNSLTQNSADTKEIISECEIIGVEQHHKYMYSIQFMIFDI